MNGQTDTGRPRQTFPIFPRVAALFLLLAAIGEASLYILSERMLTRELARSSLRPILIKVALHYWPIRTWAINHPGLALASLLAVASLVLALARTTLLIWHNQIVARLSGTHFSSEVHGFPMRKVDLISQVMCRPKGMQFVGLTPRRSFFGWRWRPLYISQRQRTMHRHVIGKTGSGKTLSVLWPSVLQDALDGKGILVMDAKGSQENISIMKAIAVATGREKQLRVFCLPAWNQPHLFSHTYNMVQVRPRSPGDSVG